MHFEVESDRNVTVDAIGLLEAGVPVVVTEEAKALFKVLHGVELVQANLPHFVKLTMVVTDSPGEEG